MPAATTALGPIRSKPGHEANPPVINGLLAVNHNQLSNNFKRGSVSNMRMTLKSIAQRLDVSTASVSNAFNRPDQLSADLRARILKECARLGYHGPNHAARSLRTGKSGIVGVMLADSLAYNFKDPCAIEFMRGVAESLDNQRVNLLLMPGGESSFDQQALETIPDCFILYGPPNDRSVLGRLQSQHKPIVAVDFTIPNHLSLNIDNYQGAYEAAHHVFSKVGTVDGTLDSTAVAVVGLRLLDQQAISTIAGRTLFEADVSISRVRLDGFRAAARDLGCTLPDSLVWHTHDSAWNDGVEAAELALQTQPRPRALLCMSDQLALAALSVARSQGLRVPEDVAIVGFDDIPAAQQSHPSLSTVYQPSLEKGRLAARMVMAPDKHHNTVLPTKFIVRESSALK